MTTLIKIVIIIASLLECLGLISVAVGICAIMWWLLSLGGVAKWVTIGILTSWGGALLHGVMTEWQYRRRVR